MNELVRVGIIICDRYHTCAGGKCLRAVRNREGAFAAYKDRDVELVGYPPSPHIEAFRRFIPEKYGMQVVVGTHPIPQKYFLTHDRCGTWQGAEWKPLLESTFNLRRPWISAGVRELNLQGPAWRGNLNCPAAAYSCGRDVVYRRSSFLRGHFRRASSGGAGADVAEWSPILLPRARIPGQTSRPSVTSTDS